MTEEAMDSYGSAEAEPRDEQSDLKWAVEWLVKEKGQRRAAKALGVNRKTVALALRRERLTSRMNLAVQRYLYGTRGSEGRQEMPLDRIESQVGGLVESVDEIYRLVDRLALRVEALEEAQPQPKEPEAESEERLWELEIALVGEHGLTMPPRHRPLGQPQTEDAGSLAHADPREGAQRAGLGADQAVDATDSDTRRVAELVPIPYDFGRLLKAPSP